MKQCFSQQTTARRTVADRKTRFFCVFMAVLMLFSCMPIGNLTSFAAVEYTNAYGHEISYNPKPLMVEGKPVRFFDDAMTELKVINNMNPKEQWYYLLNNGFNLNRLCKVNSDPERTFNSTATYAFNGSINKNKNAKFGAEYSFSTIVDGNVPVLGPKNDISFAFAYSVWNRFYDGYEGLSLKKINKSTISKVHFMGVVSTYEGKDYRNKFVYNNYTSAEKLSFGADSWKKGNNSGNFTFSFTGDAFKGGPKDTYLMNGMLLGKDSTGPQISQVSITREMPQSDRFPQSVAYLNSDDIGKTVYISVQFNEPVKFSDTFGTGDVLMRKLADFQLTLNTSGIGKSSAMEMGAHFLKFEPSQSNRNPFMIFEYVVQDPNDPNAPSYGRKDQYFEIKSVEVTSVKNGDFYKYLTDMAGNPFNHVAGNDGASKQETNVGSNGKGVIVDLESFFVDSIEIAPRGSTILTGQNKDYFSMGSSFMVTLNLNKSMANSSFHTTNAPEITLNLERSVSGGQWEKITQKPAVQGEYPPVTSGVYRESDNSRNQTNLKYSFSIPESADTKYRLPEGEPIRVINIEGGTIRDTVNNPITFDPKKPPEPKERRYVDTERPGVSLSFTHVTDNIFMAHVTMTDDNPIGPSKASFTVKSDVNSSSPMQWQIGDAEGNYGSTWINAAIGKSFSETLPFNTVNGPLIDKTGNAILFIKMPEVVPTSIDEIVVSVSVTDAVGNISSAIEGVYDLGYENTAPTISLLQSSAAEGIAVTAVIYDKSVTTYEYAWLDGHDQPEPAAVNYVAGGSLSAGDNVFLITYSGSLSANAIHNKTLWVKVKDKNDSMTSKVLNCSYDNRYGEIDIISVTPGDYNEPDRILLLDEAAAVSILLSEVAWYQYSWYEWDENFDYEAEALSSDYQYSSGYYYQQQTVYVNGSTSDTLTLDADTQIYGRFPNGDSDYLYRDSVIAARDSSRPVVLVIRARGIASSAPGGVADTYKIIKFNTFYNVENAMGCYPVRFSRNDIFGQRQDTIRRWDTVYGSLDFELVSPYDRDSNDNNAAANEYVTMTDLYDFADLEFVIKGYGDGNFSMVDFTSANTKLIMKKIAFTVNPMNYREHPETVVSSEIIETWPITEDILSRLSYDEWLVAVDRDSDGFIDYHGVYGFNISLPIDKMDKISYEIDEETGQLRLIRYEFCLNTDYTVASGLSDFEEPICRLAFQNTMPGSYSIEWDYGADAKQYPLRDARLQWDGNKVVDTTTTAVRAFFNDDDLDFIYFDPDAPVDYYMDTRMTSDMPELAVMRISRFSNLHNILLYGTADDLVYENGEYRIKEKQFTDIGSLRTNKIENLAGESALLMRYYDLDGILPDRGETQAIYYQFYFGEGSGLYTPVMRLDMMWDDIAPVVTLAVSETDPTASDVFVNVLSINDGHMESDGAGDEYYMVDTPSSEIKVTVEAKYDDGADVVPMDEGIYIFTENGYITVTAVDLAGNKTVETHVVDNIMRIPPKVNGTPVVDSVKGKFTITASIDESNATSAYIRFDDNYSECLAGVAGDIRFPVENTPGVFSAVVTRGGPFDPETGKNTGPIESIMLEVYAKAGETMKTAMLIVTDNLGNTAELPIALGDGLVGVVPHVLNAGMEYTYGGTLDFSTPVELMDMIGIPAGYAVSHGSLPIYTDGQVIINYMDLFGESYMETITAKVHGAAYAHGVTIAPEMVTNGNVTVAIDTTGYSADVQGGTGGVFTKTMTDNGAVAYTIIPSDSGFEPRNYIVDVTNIDKTAPIAHCIRTVNGIETYNEGVIEVVGSVTYTILGFDQNDTCLLEDEMNTVTFIDPGTHTFRFVDAAGNAGTYFADESATVFTLPVDLAIASYRLTYSVSGTGMDALSLGRFEPGDDVFSFEPINNDVLVLVQALNAAGDVIPAVMTVGSPLSNVKYYLDQGIVVFGADGSTVVTLTTAANSMNIPINIPVGSIDKTAPTGKVSYVMLENDETAGDGTVFKKGAVKAYVLPDNPSEIDSIFGDGVRQDGDGWFIYFEENSSAVFYLVDRAGNIGSVVAGAFDIDSQAPVIVSESWYSTIAAKPEAANGTSGNTVEDVLGTPTNNSIRLFFMFDELISRADVTVYADTYTEGNVPLPHTSSYVLASVSGNTLTLEFKENCQAKIVVYDTKGNAVTLLRPEDGPITVIDKKAPIVVSESSPVVLDNKVSITYTFNEEVTSAIEKTVYARQHTVVFEKNGINQLVFADKAGNVRNIVVHITQIDDESPSIYYVLQVEQGANIILEDPGETDPSKQMIRATNGNVEIIVGAEDQNGVAFEVMNRNKPSLPLPLVAPTIVPDTAREYKAAVATENGIHVIRATDDYGNTNTVYVNIDFIDKTAPKIVLVSTKTVEIIAGSDMSKEQLRTELLADASAIDDVSENITVTVDVESVQFDTVGNYTVTYSAQDNLGNAAQKTRTVAVVSAARIAVTIDGKSVLANGTYTTAAGNLTVSAPEGWRLYWTKGFKTRAELKYGTLLNGMIPVFERGDYTILAQNQERDAFVVYVYVY